MMFSKGNLRSSLLVIECPETLEWHSQGGKIIQVSYRQ
jgi:hypothetical protein